MEHVYVGPYCFPIYSHPRFRQQVQDGNAIQASVEAVLGDADILHVVSTFAEQMAQAGRFNADDTDIDALLRLMCEGAETSGYSQRGASASTDRAGDAKCTPLDGIPLPPAGAAAVKSCLFENTGSAFPPQRQQTAEARRPEERHPTKRAPQRYAQPHKWKPTESRRHQPTVAYGTSAPVVTRGVEPLAGAPNTATHNSRVMPTLLPVVLSTKYMLEKCGKTTARLPAPDLLSLQDSETSFTIPAKNIRDPVDECVVSPPLHTHDALKRVLQVALYSLIHVRLGEDRQGGNSATVAITPGAIDRARRAHRAVDGGQLQLVPDNTYAAMDVLLDGNSSCISRRHRPSKLSPMQLSQVILNQEQMQSVTGGGGPMSRIYPTSNVGQDLRARQIAVARGTKKALQQRQQHYSSSPASSRQYAPLALLPLGVDALTIYSNPHSGPFPVAKPQRCSAPSTVPFNMRAGGRRVYLPTIPWKPDLDLSRTTLRIEEEEETDQHQAFGSASATSKYASWQRAVATVKRFPL